MTALATAIRFAQQGPVLKDPLLASWSLRQPPGAHDHRDGAAGPHHDVESGGRRRGGKRSTPLRSTEPPRNFPLLLLPSPRLAFVQ